MADILEQLNAWLWGPWLIGLFIGTGIFLTVRLNFLPLKNLGFALRVLISSILHPDKDGQGSISPFQSLMTAMAAMMGTGNIAGVATAMVLGGPGALLWMVAAAAFSMTLSLAEHILSLKYRKIHKDGSVLGGPMIVMEQCIKPKFLGKILAVLFCIFTLGASIGMGNMTQSNSAAIALNDSFSVPLFVSGLIMALLSLFILMGGIQCIGKVCGFLVPLMSVAYLIFTFCVIVINRGQLFDGIHDILDSAFSVSCVTGGIGGFFVSDMFKSMRWGIARGIFSNEAGLGSAPIAAVEAKTQNPLKQSYIAMTGTFFDTVIVCSMTGLAIASSGLLGTLDAHGNPVTGAALTNLVFESALGTPGRYVVTIGLVLFAFATIIGWEYYGEKALEFILGKCIKNTANTAKKAILFVYRLIYCGCVFVGAVTTLTSVWNFSDIMNGCMALPNLLCLILLRKEICQSILQEQ